MINFIEEKKIKAKDNEITLEYQLIFENLI